MDVVEYTAEIIVSFIFGEFIMLAMMQTAPFTKLTQPYKGGGLLISSSFLAICMYWLYRSISVYIVGPVASGGPTYELKLELFFS